ncbi:MAG: hypothetical protein Fur002_13660 [Anaerolineales bacterium]
MNRLQALLDSWKADDSIAANFSAWKVSPPRAARLLTFPDGLPQALRQALTSLGIESLYVHQHAAWVHARAGENLILATGVASGKTLAYNLPALTALLEDEQARALYLFPTKALAQDQLSALSEQLSAVSRPLAAAIYDGDTPQAQRAQIRKRARIILSNPDMLHTGILPHHTNWSEFFSHLKFIIIDEAHTYRGVFGSHVANVLRRVKRVAAFYGAHPQFILASATIGNPKELAELLIEEPAALIDDDGSARGQRHFIFYNPPVTDAALGLRKSAVQECIRLGGDLLRHDVQCVTFARTRRGVEILLTLLQSQYPEYKKFIRGYRSGYLPAQRREIEAALRDGSAKMTVATTALELGIDIGGLGAALLLGYPGSIAGARQQAGRAGRGEQPALALMLASPDPLDQFLAHHPEYFFGASPERALLNANHPLILLEHLRCALFELPFRKGESFGALDAQTLADYLDFLLEEHAAHFSNETYYWMQDAYPAAAVSLRSASPRSVTLTAVDEDARPRVIGVVDGESAAWMVHPAAIYMHEGQQYFVQTLDMEKGAAQLIPVGLDYYTEPQRTSQIEVLSETAHQTMTGGLKAHGEIQVTTQVVGFRKLRWFTNENLGEEVLELPPATLQTTGYWFSLNEQTLARLRGLGLWNNDPNDYGKSWNQIRDSVRARDSYRCQICGAAETARQHDVHHKTPFRSFASAQEANRLENLITLCRTCHHKAEQNLRIRSGLAGLGFALARLAPLFLMCDPRDLSTLADPAWQPANGMPAVVLYENVAAGIGFSQRLYEIHGELLRRAFELVSECPCEDGCPSCVGPGGENGAGGKRETLAILEEVTAPQTG